MDLPLLRDPRLIPALAEISAFATAFIALIALSAVSKQFWRKPSDVFARRIALAILAMVAMTHALSPDPAPQIAQQFAFCALLIIIAMGSGPRKEPWHG